MEYGYVHCAFLVCETVLIMWGNTLALCLLFLKMQWSDEDLCLLIGQ